MEKRMGLPSFSERATCIDFHSSSPKTKSRASEAYSLIDRGFKIFCHRMQKYTKGKIPVDVLTNF